MAITLINQPSSISPVYNPYYFKVFDTGSNIVPGYRFVFGLFETGETIPYATFRVAPQPNSEGFIDLSKILQSKLSATNLLKESVEIISATDSHYTFDLKVTNENFIYQDFLDYEFVSSGVHYGKVKLTTSTFSSYFVSDLINVRISPSITDNRKNLNGTFKVLTLDPAYIIIDLLFSIVGDGPTTPGTTWYFDQRKTALSWTSSVVEVDNLLVYNQAVPFTDFPGWNETFISPTNDEEPTGDILTNSPNWFETQKEKDKYIIKPYQELYWNAFNRPINSGIGSYYANTMIVENEFGDKWMLTDYTNWDDPLIAMRQFNVSPDNQNWINITPNFGNTGGYQYGINPYTNITSTGELRESRYLDYWTTFAPGNDDCDEIILFIQLDPTVPGPPTEDYVFTARPVGRGFNGRRIYSTIIDDKPVVIWSDIISPSVRNWKITFTSGNPIQPATQYQSFATRTSNALPFGQSYAISNSVDAWKAFDGNPTTFYQTTDNSGTASITYNFSTGAIRWADIQSYTINKGGAIVNAPTAWRVEASQDGSTWTVVHTVTGNLTNSTYNSPQLGGVVKWAYVRLVVTAAFAPIIGPTNVRIFEFSINSNATVATMISANDCPIDLGFTPWSWTGPNPPVGMTATVLETFANGPFTFPTLKKRRVYLDYDCEINTTQLLFLDRAGSYSSFAFPLRRVESGKNEKLNYKSNVDFYTDGTTIYNTYDSENLVYSSMVEKTYRLTTDWLNTSMSDYFEELITSPEVYIKLNSETDNGRDGEGQPSPWLACTVIDTDFINPKQKDKRLINRTITVRLNSNNSINI